MKRSFLALLLIVTALAARANYSEFVLGGTKYVTSFEVSALKVDEYRKKGTWQLGEGEPPVGPNRAYTLASAAFKEQFGGQVVGEVRFVVLRILGVQDFNLPYWEVVFVEKLTPEEIQKRLGADGRVPTANMSYFVFMNGEVVRPRKV